MYIIAIAWIYVTLLMALTETNVTAGILTFALYGVLPLALLLWLFGSPIRRRRLHGDAERLDQAVGKGDQADTDTDK
jgi:membrane protein implicated in regulation of membrane protease activity